MASKDIHSEKVSKGSRTYFFDIKKCSNDGLYLKMSCSQKTSAGFEHHRLIVFDRDFSEFMAALKKSTAELQKLMQQATMQKQKPVE